jgi:periplasmic divalent cation tolerance protein
MSQETIVVTNTGSLAEARKIARALVDSKLAACVNIVPGLESTYWWQGQVETAAEWMVLIKTVRAKFPAVRELIEELHSYDLPECIELVIEEGSPEYLKWIRDSIER